MLWALLHLVETLLRVCGEIELPVVDTSRGSSHFSSI